MRPMPSPHVIAAIAATALAMSLASGAGAATKRTRHHRHTIVGVAPAEPLPPRTIPRDYSFYPEHVEGGIDGNLPFNNQIRKMVDPLNANGAGR